VVIAWRRTRRSRGRAGGGSKRVVVPAVAVFPGLRAPESSGRLSCWPAAYGMQLGAGEREVPISIAHLRHGRCAWVEARDPAVLVLDRVV